MKGGAVLGGGGGLTVLAFLATAMCDNSLLSCEHERLVTM